MRRGLAEDQAEKRAALLGDVAEVIFYRRRHSGRGPGRRS
jgi:hypothetical protein